MSLPRVIQGGMGVAVSGWRLANAVSRAGGLGIVSGTGLDTVLVRRLQDGDPEGALRRALARFPNPRTAEKIRRRYFLPGGKGPRRPYLPAGMFDVEPPRDLVELACAAGFVEVHLAKEGHGGPVGINFLEKIQLPTLPILYGALLAGVDVVAMGAGIPRSIPRVLDELSAGKASSLKLHVEGAFPGEEFRTRFDPRWVWEGEPPALKRPFFLAVVASAVLAVSLARKAEGRVDGFVAEGPEAGGHNAPPRGPLRLDARGEPVYGPKDTVDPAALREIDRPFWLAGGFGRRGSLPEALAAGAAGIQVGTLFAYCRESDIAEPLKRAVIDRVRRGEAEVFCDPLASPTGFPFRVVRLPGTLSDPEVYRRRSRVCDMGYLRTAYRRADGTVGFRCPGEPVEAFVRKGGRREEAEGRLCLCNGLLSTVGLAQRRAEGAKEPPLVTSGAALARVAELLPPGGGDYTAADVVAYLGGP